MKVVRLNDVEAGLKKLGLHTERGRTKVPEWSRLFVHVPMGTDKHGNKKPTLYICRMSFHHGLLNSYKFFGMPEYYCAAIKLMVDQGKILNHLMYYTLGVKAYNATVHLKDESLDCDSKKKSLAKLREFYYQKSLMFSRLFKQRYYGIVNEPLPASNSTYR